MAIITTTTPVTLTATASCPIAEFNGPYTYTWTFSSGTGATTGSPILHTFTAYGNQTAACTATNTSTNATKTVQVPVYVYRFSMNGLAQISTRRISLGGVLTNTGKVLMPLAWDGTNGNGCWLYDPTNNTAAAKAPVASYLSTNFHTTAGMVKLADGRIMVAGGTLSYREVAFYTEGTNSWTSGTNMPASSGNMPGLYLLPSGNVASVAGSQKHYVYNVAGDSWGPLITIPVYSSYTLSIQLQDGSILAWSDFMGTIGTAFPVYRWSETGAYTTWTQVATLPAGHGQSKGACLLQDGRVLFAGAVDSGGSGNYTGEVYIYNPADNSLVTKNPMPTPYWGPMIAVDYDTVLMFCAAAPSASSSGASKKVIAYSISTDTWNLTACADLTQPCDFSPLYSRSWQKMLHLVADGSGNPMVWVSAGDAATSYRYYQTYNI